MGPTFHGHVYIRTLCIKTSIYLDRRPGLVVMGGDSSSEGREFESQQRILDSHIFHFRIVMFA